MIRTGKNFEHFNKKIGDVHPLNILFNTKGKIKIVSQLSFPEEMTNFEIAVVDKSVKNYLAPEEIFHTSGNGDYPSTVNPNKAEVFSIGMTILALGSLNSCQEVYKNSGIN